MCVCVCACVCKKIHNGYVTGTKMIMIFSLKIKYQTKEMRTEADTRMSSSLCGTIAPSVVGRARGEGTTALIS